jgi:hypothetical protein
MSTNDSRVVVRQGPVVLPGVQAAACWLLVTAFYGVAAAWLTWPQAALIGQAIVGGPIAESDGWQNVWNLWWIRRAVLTGANPFATDLLFWPDGVALGLHTLTFTNAVLTLPVLLLGGPIAAYGVAALLNYTLSGLAIALLALRATGSRLGAFGAGLVGVLAPVHFARFQEGQHHGALQWIALYALALLYAEERRTWRSGIALALTAALVCYYSWYQALFLALLTLTWLIVGIAGARSAWPMLRPWLVAAPLLLVLLAPVAPSIVEGLRSAGRGAEHWITQAGFYSVDLVDLVLPSAYHPLYGAQVRAFQEPLHPNSIGWVVTTGYVALLLAAFGAMTRWSAARRWAIVALVLLCFSLGPVLRVAGVDTGLPMPYALILSLPGANFGRRPALAVVVALVPLAVLVAFGIQSVQQRVRAPLCHGIFAALLAALLFECTPGGLRAFADTTEPFYASLRGGAGAVLEIPLDPGDLAYKTASMRAQMIHQRPIIGGYVARRPDYPLARGAPVIGQLASRRCDEDHILPHDASTALAALNAYQIGTIVVHPERLSRARLACARVLLEERLQLRPVPTGGAARVYSVPYVAPRPFAYLDSNWYEQEQARGRFWRWMADQADIYLVNTNAAPAWFELSLEAQSFQRPRPVALTFDNRQLGSLLIANDVARLYRIPIFVPPGEHRLHLSAPAQPELGGEGRPLSIVLRSAAFHELSP